MFVGGLFVTVRVSDMEDERNWLRVVNVAGVDAPMLECVAG
jgi:hypothetical protein